MSRLRRLESSVQAPVAPDSPRGAQRRFQRGSETEDEAAAVPADEAVEAVASPNGETP